MKKILIGLLTITLLASCAAQEEKIKSVSLATDTTVSDMDMSIMSLSQMTQNMDNMKGMMSQIEKIDYQYSSPSGINNMNIEYILNNLGQISQISITSKKLNGYLESFNIGAQEILIGKTLKDASNMRVISGSSLTTNAFREAIKSTI